MPVLPILAIGWNQSADHQRRIGNASRWRQDMSLKPAMSVMMAWSKNDGSVISIDSV